MEEQIVERMEGSGGARNGGARVTPRPVVAPPLPVAAPPLDWLTVAPPLPMAAPPLDWLTVAPPLDLLTVAPPLPVAAPPLDWLRVKQMVEPLPVAAPPLDWPRVKQMVEARTMKHFSHDHELRLRPIKREKDESLSCFLCEDPVVGPNYSCSQRSEKFILHESCAELPREILKYPFHSCKHPLILGTSSSSRYACGVCHQEYNGGFSYTCSECDFKVDIKCSKIDYQPEHFIHKHPLMLNEDVAEAAGRPVSCSGCKDPVLGRNYYSCNRCSDFILHKSCVQLPRNIQHPIHNEHPLILTTPTSIESSDYRTYHCHICYSELFTNRYYYTCDKCKFHLDFKCTSNWSNKQCIEHFSHEHLLFFGDFNKELNERCTMCDDRVFGLTYGCSWRLGQWIEFYCDFFLHKSCAELPREIGQHPLHRQHPLVLKETEELSRPPVCSACKNMCWANYIYSCSACVFDLDVKCASKWISGSLDSLQHFSHEHPLKFKDIHKEEEAYSGPPVVCDGCQDPVVGPRYTCPRRKCCFNLHKSCAELASEIQHPAHRQHPLFLLNTIQNVTVACFCNACNQVCRYRYNCSICDFNLHLKCASNWQKIFDSHEHQFAVPRKEMAELHLNCDICGEYKSGTVCYVCGICQILVHKECASLPPFNKTPAHQHRLKLTWFLEDMYPSKDHICNLCSTNIDKCRAVYCCHECRNYVAHTTCITVDYFREQEENQNRTTDDDDDADDNEYDVAGQIKHFIHQHFLVANDHRQVLKEDDRIITCEGCIRPITTITQDFYSCAKQEEESCHFFLHKICAQLPPRKLLPLLHTHQFTLLSRASSIDGVFQCFVCGIFKQGFAYSCDTCALPNGENRFYLDLQCFTYWVNRRDLKHESHAHRLVLNTKGENVCCRGCGSSIFFSFSCERCDFHVCVSCVQLPLTARHRYDEHPLKLTYASVEHEAGQYYCEICEGKRDPTHWFYQCKEQCEFDFHPHCLIGRYPQVKLGSTYKHDAHVQHLVTLVSKWKSPIRFDKRDNILPCEKCGKLCQGLVFECKECNINFHREGFCGTADVETSQVSPQIEEL